MFEDLAATGGMRFLLAAAAVAAGLIILVAVLWILKNRPSSPFVRGGKNRQPRLAVLDAAAVDTRRRLVLVRRDEVEHLIMIGGPTDIVIESRIVGAQPAASAPTTLAETRRATEPSPPLAAQPSYQSPRPPVPERRAEPRPAAAAPQPPVGAPPISSMGQALYGESTGTSPQQGRPQPAARPPAAAPARAEAPRPPQPRPEQPRPDQVRPDQARPDPARAETMRLDPQRAEPSRPDPRSAPPAGRSPEDILDAARNRVLNTPPTEARPSAAANPAPPAPVAEPQRRSDSGDFERLLDAEISGDLNRLTATPARPAALPAARNEPTLEEEMNRMLGEMGQRRS